MFYPPLKEIVGCVGLYLQAQKENLELRRIGWKGRAWQLGHKGGGGNHSRLPFVSGPVADWCGASVATSRERLASPTGAPNCVAATIPVTALSWLAAQLAAQLAGCLDRMAGPCGPGALPACPALPCWLVLPTLLPGSACLAGCACLTHQLARVCACARFVNAACSLPLAARLPVELGPPPPFA